MLCARRHAVDLRGDKLEAQVKVRRRIKRNRIGQGPDSEMVGERPGEVKRADEILRAAIARLKSASRRHCGRLDAEAEDEVWKRTAVTEGGVPIMSALLEMA